MTAELHRVFRHLPELKTQRLILRPIQRKDADDIFEYARDEEITRYVMWEAHRSIADTYEYIHEIRRQYRHGWPSQFGIQLLETGQLIGTIGFMWINVDHRSAEIGYSLSRKYWNHGYMTEALTAVIRFAFETLHLHRLEAQHDVRNPASGRVMQKAGMQFEGTLRDRIRLRGKYCTVNLYAIVENDLQKQR